MRVLGVMNNAREMLRQIVAIDNRHVPGTKNNWNQVKSLECKVADMAYMNLRSQKENIQHQIRRLQTPNAVKRFIKI